MPDKKGVKEMNSFLKKFRKLAYVLLIPICLVGLAACGTNGEKQAKLGQQFELSPGQSVSITGEGYVIKFVKVISDSRCPKNAQCIRAGEVTCSIEISNTSEASQPVAMTITQPGLTDEPATQDFDGHRLTFSVEPYPSAGQTIGENQYKLEATVTKN